MEKKGGGLLVLILGLVFVVRLGSNVVKLYKAGGRLSEEETKLVEVKKKNQELKERLAQVQTPQYMEKEAREKLGMGKEGEVVVIVPADEVSTANKVVSKQGNEPNWVRWRRLYLRF
jgi:cell division protein FtsB